jgi:hypothetical protein
MYLKPEQPCPRCSNKGKPEATCPICVGIGFVGDPLDSLARAMSYRYANLFPGMPREAKEIERTTILHALFAYKYCYDEQPVQVIATEVPFRVPLIDPETRKAVPDVFIDGKIDKLVRYLDSAPMVMEHKSTSSDLAPESDYWGHLRLDTQTMIYVYAAQRLQADGLLEPWKIMADGPPISEILYDVWRKPAIRPKKLSQAEVTELLESGSYFDQAFDCKWNADSCEFSVDDEFVQVERLKSGAPVICETPDMYGARLFNEINEKPDRYFARRTLVRSSVEIERFEIELFNLYRAVKNQAWFHNEHSCDNYGRCDYCQFCFTGQEIDPSKPPAGFVNIFDKKGK